MNRQLHVSHESSAAREPWIVSCTWAMGFMSDAIANRWVVKCLHTYVHIHIHAYAHTCINTRCIHTHTHTHTGHPRLIGCRERGQIIDSRPEWLRTAGHLPFASACRDRKSQHERLRPRLQRQSMGAWPQHHGRVLVHQGWQCPVLASCVRVSVCLRDTVHCLSAAVVAC